jgi:hypothetical protein
VTVLLQAAHHHAMLDKPADKDGKFTVREHIAAAVARGKMSPEELDGPEIPDAGWYLWEWYGELAACRTHSGVSGAPEPITYRDIAAWAELMHRHLTPEEVEALLAIDRVSRNPDAYTEALS